MRSVISEAAGLFANLDRLGLDKHALIQAMVAKLHAYAVSEQNTDDKKTEDKAEK